MAGLNNLLSNTAQQTTTMPAWYDTAQQNIASGAGQVYNQAPAPQNTVAQNAVNTLSGPTNPFNQAASTMQGIATGAANPWLVSDTGQVTPNTSTALGGLFQAQNQQLQQMIPNITAAPDASAIGSGQFGSLRNQTAYDKSIADAQANLFAQQNAAALQNQQTGVSAGAQAGNLAQQGINNELTVGQYQQAAPFTNVANYGKVIGGLTAPTTVSNQTQLSPLNQLGTFLSATGVGSGSNVLSGLGNFGSNLISGVSNLLNPSAGNTTAPIQYNAAGQAVDQFGNLLATNAQNAYGNTGTLDQQNAAQTGSTGLGADVAQTGT